MIDWIRNRSAQVVQHLLRALINFLAVMKKKKKLTIRPKKKTKFKTKILIFQKLIYYERKQKKEHLSPE